MPASNSSSIAWEIASRYLAAWVDAVPNAPPLHYIEGFPGPNLADRVQALDARGLVTIFQEDPVVAERCRRELASIATPHIQLVEVDFTTGIAGLSHVQDEAAQTFCYLDPPGPGKLPFGALQMAAGFPNLDLLIRFPADDLQKQARFRGTPLADLPPYARRVVEGYSSLLGDRRHEWLGTWRRIESAAGPAAADMALVEQFGKRLAGIAAGRHLKQLTIALPDSGTLYLFCLSADPGRALTLNAVLESMGLDGYVRWEGERWRCEVPVVAAVAEPLELFGSGPPSTPLPPAREANAPDLAALIASRYVGRSVPLRVITGDLVNTDLFLDDIRAALRLLRKTGHAAYRSLRDPDARVDFPETPDPVTPSRRAGRPSEDLLL